MKKWDETINRAGELYGGSFHCCEAITLAVSEHFGYKNDLLLKITSPFGGGMTANGSACGSLIAAYLCMGIFKGRSSADENRDAANGSADRIYKKFCEKYGSPDCRNIIGYDRKDPKAVELYAKKVKCEVCIPLAKEVTGWILEELELKDENE